MDLQNEYEPLKYLKKKKHNFREIKRITSIHTFHIIMTFINNNVFYLENH